LSRSWGIVPFRHDAFALTLAERAHQRVLLLALAVHATRINRIVIVLTSGARHHVGVAFGRAWRVEFGGTRTLEFAARLHPLGVNAGLFHRVRAWAGVGIFGEVSLGVGPEGVLEVGLLKGVRRGVLAGSGYDLVGTHVVAQHVFVAVASDAEVEPLPVAFVAFEARADFVLAGGCFAFGLALGHVHFVAVAEACGPAWCVESVVKRAEFVVVLCEFRSLVGSGFLESVRSAGSKRV